MIEPKPKPKPASPNSSPNANPDPNSYPDLHPSPNQPGEPKLTHALGAASPRKEEDTYPLTPRRPESGAACPRPGSPPAHSDSHDAPHQLTRLALPSPRRMA